MELATAPAFLAQVVWLLYLAAASAPLAPQLACILAQTAMQQLALLSHIAWVVSVVLKRAQRVLLGCLSFLPAPAQQILCAARALLG